MMYCYYFRSTTVLTTMCVTTGSFLHQFITFSRGWIVSEWLSFSYLLAIVAFIGGMLTAHALLSLWRGTSFVTDLVDYEPDPFLMN